jgi:hypothetical protein
MGARTGLSGGRRVARYYFGKKTDEVLTEIAESSVNQHAKAA